MGYSTVLAGLTISIMYIATILCRPWAGRFCDRMGAKVSVLWGMACCAAGGVLLIGAAALASVHWLSFAVIIASRLILGAGESMGATGSSLWGIASAGPEHTAKVISLNGISVYGGVALGAPLGVILAQRWGLASIGAVTILICAVSFAMAWRKSPAAVALGERLSFIHVLERVTPVGMSLALGGVSYGVLATFVTLFYASRHWNGAALCLTAYGIAYIAVRVFFTGTVNRYGGFPVAMLSFLVTSVGMPTLWRASAPWMALSGATINGLGFSLIFPALGVGGRQASFPVQWPRMKLGPLYRVFRCVVLTDRPTGRRHHRRLRLRQRLSPWLRLRARRPRHCSSAVADAEELISCARRLTLLV